MAFYSPDQAMGQTLRQLIGQLEQEGRPGLGEQLSITRIRYGASLVGGAEGLDQEAFWGQTVTGASWAGERPRYPASVVKRV